MSDSGNSPSQKFRSLLSFGVSGLLSPSCKIYYENFFGTEHLGRASDLISAHLRDLSLDEMRVRALLLFSVFEAHRNQSAIQAKDLENEPLTLECGTDDEWVAIGILFRSSLKLDAPAAESLRSRLHQGTPQGEFEKALSLIYQHSDQVILRLKPGVQMEVVSLLSLRRGQKAAMRQPGLEIVIFNELASVQETPSAEEYLELGDLNYKKLLSSHPPKKLKAPASGEYLAREFMELEKALRVRGGKLKAEESIQVKGSWQDPEDDRILVKGEKFELEDREPMTLKRMFGRVWPFKKSDETDEKEESADSSSLEPLSMKPRLENEELPKENIENLVDQLETGQLEKTVARLQAELDRLTQEKEGDHSKQKRWIEGMMKEIMAEKTRLNLTARKIEASIRDQKLQLKQAEAALLKKNHSTEDHQIRQKYDLNQKLLNNMRQDNARLNAKIEELRTQWLNAQVGSKSKEAMAQSEQSALRAKFERTQKQFEEIKAAHDRLSSENQQLLARIQYLEKEEASRLEEVKRMDAAMKQGSNHLNEIEKMRVRVEDAEYEGARLRRELQLSQQEVRTLKAKLGIKTGGGAGGGSDSGGGGGGSGRAA